MTATETFRAARDLLLRHREDHAAAYRDFRWPDLTHFNWAFDWFDVLAAEHGDDTALWVVNDDGSEQAVTFAAMAAWSSQTADWLRSNGVDRGDRLLLLLGNRVELWVTLLAAIRLGVVVIPATTLLGADAIRDRIHRGRVRHVVADSAETGKLAGIHGDYTRIAVGDPVEGWLRFADTTTWLGDFEAEVPTAADESLLLYFTSGTTAQPKLVEHTHVSYPVGHLSTMYWLGVRPGDVHLNVSSPGWAKHAWSSVFAPWNAGATVLVHAATRFDPAALLDVMARCGVTTFCAPPTVWRLLVQQDLARWQVSLREVVSAGEPLNPEVIEQVRRAWGVTVRDGYGQTETTAQIGNTPGRPVRVGSVGRPLPGYAVTLLDPLTSEPGDEGEICLDLTARPLGLMTGYRDDHARTDEVMRGGFYHTGDVATRDADGYLTYVGRSDDVFKAADYRISPFELESVLVEHEAVAEAAVVPSPDPVRTSVPKAYVTLASGHPPTRETALLLFRFARERLAPYQRVRRLEFAELPKTVSGKIRRIDLREREESAHGGWVPATVRGEHEFWEEDFTELRS